jgi:hypothetical protein
VIYSDISGPEAEYEHIIRCIPYGRKTNYYSKGTKAVYDEAF